MKPFLAYIAALAPLFFLLSCELEEGKNVDTTSTPPFIMQASVEPPTFNLAVEQTQGSFFKAPLILFVSLEDQDGLGDIATVSFAILSPDGNEEIFNGNLLDNGIKPDQTSSDGNYTAGVDVTLPATTVGIYKVKFLAVDKSGFVSTIAHRSIRVFNADNHAPVISNLVMPDTVLVPTEVQEENFVKITLNVDDQEGLVDIVRTSFLSKRPDNTTVGEYRMYDDGSDEVRQIFEGYSALSGDETANDGIYSITIPITFGTLAPTYRDFEFRAQDQSNVISNIIVKRIYLR